MQLEDRTVVITGAGRGIGRALALRCAQEGARVAACDVDQRTAAAIGAELGERHLALTCDVRREQDVRDVLEAARSRLGAVDVFVANAGVAEGGDPVSTPDAVWDRAFDVNVRAHVYAARALLPGWLERGEGCFVSVASAAGLLTQVGSAPYAVSKHAAVAFAEWLSVTYGDRGVQVSCVCPMGVNTAMLQPGEDGALDDLGRHVVRTAGDVVEPEAVAQLIVEAIGDGRFLVLPHPEVLTFFQRKGADYERWLSGMRRLQEGALATVAGSSEAGA